VFREIVHCYRRAIELEPENVEFAQALASHYILAKYFEVTDTADAEIEAWKYVLTLELTPVQRTRAMRAIGRVMFMSKGDLNSAEEWLQKALAIGDDPGCRSLLKLVQEARQGAGKGEQE